MRIGGKDFDDIPKNPNPRIFGEYQDGVRTKVRYIWIDRYVDCDGAKICESYKLTLTNYGSVALDGKPIRDQKDIETVKVLFNELGKKHN